MYDVMLIVVLLHFVCVPVLAWFDAPKAAQYFKKWENFQVSKVFSDLTIIRFHIDPILKYQNLITALTLFQEIYLFHYLGSICKVKLPC
jgi:hypothetical protein